MRFKRLLLEKREFFDYHTAPVDLLKGDVIDVNKTGVSFYDQLLPNSDDKEYMRKEKNLVGEIEYMTPQEYYEQCSKYGFPNKVVPVEKLKQERRIDKNTLEHLKAVLTEYGRKFPLPYISIAERGQEGLHRMMVIGDMFGWDNAKYPVLVIRYADEERAKIEKENKLISKYSSYIRQAVRSTLQYKFTDFDELKEQLQFDLDREFRYVDEVIKPVNFTVEEDPEDDNYYLVKVGRAQADLEKALIKWVEPQTDIDDELDLDDLELDDNEDFLRRYFGDNWRETHPHLKDTFGIKESYEDINVTYIEQGWSRETAHPTAQKYWTEEKPSLGQCAITALYLNEKYGYSIWETLIDNRNRHFFNKDNDGNIIDLTKDQFSSDVKIDYENSRQRDPKQLLRSCNTRYQLFKKNLNTNINEDVKRLDIKQMDQYVMMEFSQNDPGEGCIFIHPNGKFINIHPKLDDHEDLCYWLEEQGFDENPEDAYWFVEEFKYIRCRNSLHLCFVDLPIHVTREQLDSLQLWLETKVSSDTLDICTPDGFKNYNLDEYFPEDIIKLIKRYLSSGKLYEKLNK